MKSIKALGLTLLATLGVSVLGATSAQAHYWRINGSEVHGTEKYPVSSTATLRFHLKRAEIESECTMLRTGTVTGSGKGQITSITSTAGEKSIECKLTYHASTCGKEHLEARGLPWSTELVTNSEGKLENKLVGAPEWGLKCTEFGETDCLVASPFEHNLKGGVEQEYALKSESPGCTTFQGLETLGSELLQAKVGTLEAK